MSRLRGLLHNAAQLRHRPWLRWMGPALHHPRVWHMSRRGISLGVGIGVFFGLMLPLAQIPAAAVVAVFMRANVPVAAVRLVATGWQAGHRGAAGHGHDQRAVDLCADRLAAATAHPALVVAARAAAA